MHVIILILETSDTNNYFKVLLEHGLQSMHSNLYIK